MICEKDCFSCELPDCIYTTYSGTPEEQEYRRNYMREWRRKNPDKYEQSKKAVRERYHSLKAQGICICCGRRKAVGGIRCPECAKNNAECLKRFRERKRKAV